MTRLKYDNIVSAFREDPEVREAVRRYHDIWWSAGPRATAAVSAVAINMMELAGDEQVEWWGKFRKDAVDIEEVG